MKRILLVEDDLSLINGLMFAIQKQGFEVENARTKAEALDLWERGEFDLIILDVTLPDGNGYEICRLIRQSSDIPIMFLTAADEETDITMGLDIGGDDYLSKPFKLAVLFSRINALLRRSEGYVRKDEGLVSKDIRIDLHNGEAFKNEHRLELTAGEYRLLKLFLENKNQLLSSEQILASLWDCDERFVDTNTLTVYIRRLRVKIEDDPGNPTKIVTVRGLGYRWSE